MTRRRRGERGATSIELAMYMPILLLGIFATVQFSLMYLGDRAAQSAAREAARVARAGGGTPQALADAVVRGAAYAAAVGRGVLFDPTVAVVRVGGNQIRATVGGRTLNLTPGVTSPTIHESVQGPIEIFRPDTP